MKTSKSLSILMILGALLWPASFAPTAQGQPGGKRLQADSGVIRLGPDQILRITFDGGAGNDTVNVRFRRMYYAGSTNGGIWRGSVAAQDISDPITLTQEEAASTNISQAGFDGVRGVVIIRGYTGATTVNAGVLFQIIKASTGEVVSVWNDTDIIH